MSMGIKLFFTLIVIVSITNSEFNLYLIFLLLLIFNQIYTLSVNAQYGFPQTKKCHLLKNTIVHKTGFCELRKCHNDDTDTMSCHIFKGIELCDCKRGYLFNKCTGECVRPKQCPKVVGGKVICK